MFILGVLSQINIQKYETERINSIIQNQTSNHIKSVRNKKLYLSYCVDSTTHVYQKNTGNNDIEQFCFGNVFDNNGQSFDPNSMNYENTETLGEYFIQNYWGNYILISYDSNSDLLSIFRNPTGKPYIFYTIINYQIVFSNSIKLIVDYLGKKPNFHLPYASSYIRKSFIDSEETPFSNIFELPLGFRILFNRNQIKEKKLIWDPYNYAGKNISKKDFEEQFIDTTKMVVSAQVKAADKIVLDFSGGFDSTTLLHFISSYCNNKNILALNFHDKDINSSNELEHARKITKALGIKLEELELSSLLPFSEIDSKNKIFPNWPTANMVYHKKFLHIDKTYINHNSNFNTAYLSGHGGDNIFMCPSLKESLTDYFMDQGYDGLINKIQEFSLLNRDPLFSLLSFLTKNYTRHRFDSFFRLNNFTKPANTIQWLTDKAYNLALIKPNAAYQQSNSILPGKKALLESIMLGLSTTKCNLINNNSTALYPFFSQKLIELCLSFPTYNSFGRGYDRYHVRSLVAKHFNSTFVWRKDKGETSGILQKGIIRNNKKIMELCMEGFCARNELIDRDLLYKDISNLKHGINDNQWPVSSLITMEIFYQMWQN